MPRTRCDPFSRGSDVGGGWLVADRGIYDSVGPKRNPVSKGLMKLPSRFGVRGGVGRLRFMLGGVMDTFSPTKSAEQVVGPSVRE
jgi:hypothetical protein